MGRFAPNVQRSAFEAGSLRSRRSRRAATIHLTSTLDVERWTLNVLRPMRVVVINTGTEILLGDVLNTHLTFIAREIFPLGLRVERQISVPDGSAIRDALSENFDRADLIFVTGGLGPTTDDITREITAELLGLELVPDPELETLDHAAFAHARDPVDRPHPAPGPGAAWRRGFAQRKWKRARSLPRRRPGRGRCIAPFVSPPGTAARAATDVSPVGRAHPSTNR